MFPVTGNIPTDRGTLVNIDILYKSIFANVDGVFRPGKLTRQVIGLYQRSLQFVLPRIKIRVFHICQVQVILPGKGAFSLFHFPFKADIGPPVFIQGAVTAAAKVKAYARTAFTVGGYRTGLVHHLVPAICNQDAVAPEPVCPNLRFLRNHESILHAVYPHAGGALALSQDICPLGHGVAGAVNMKADA